MNTRPHVLVLAAVLLLTAGAAAAATVPETAYSDLHWRLVGPHRGGWATAVAGVPGDSATFFFGAADGGVWKTTDAGTTWRPLFDRYGSASIGAPTGGATVTRHLEVVMDPRVAVGDGELEALLDFQRQVEAALARAVALSREPEARALTSLATDLESADAEPTEPSERCSPGPSSNWTEASEWLTARQLRILEDLLRSSL